MPPIAEINVPITRSVRSSSSDEMNANCNKNPTTGETKTQVDNESNKPQPVLQQQPQQQQSRQEESRTEESPIHSQNSNDYNNNTNLESSWTMDDEDGIFIESLPSTNHNSKESNSSPIVEKDTPSNNVRRAGTSKISDSSVILLSPHLRSNLMREQGERDPLFFYEVVKTLGTGSMGSVARVRKRQQAVGGSARKEIQEAVKEQKRRQKCLNIPIIGGFFRLCIDGNLTHHPSSSNGSNNRNAFLPLTTTTTNPPPPPPIPHPELIIRRESSILLAPTATATTTTTINVTDTVPMMDRSGMRSKINSLSSMASMCSYDPGPTHVSKIEYAMKSIHLSSVTDRTFIEELKNEISILKALDHPHIVRAIETFSHKNQIFIVMELCSGGDLYSRDPYTEESAARIVSSILSAIAYMHSRKICHRDLKYENVLYVNDSPTAEVKLIDFGLSKVYGENGHLTEGVGTIYTMAPEVLTGSYTQKADVWSIGVITYMLLSSQMPFFGRKRRQIVEQILNCQYDFRGRRWKQISEQAKDFIEDLLVLDPDDRLDAAKAMSSMWLNKRFAATTRAPHVEEETLVCKAMVRYASYTKLKKMSLMVVAHKSTTEEIGILRKVFQKYDSRRDGTISYDEFCEALNDSGLESEDLRSMFTAVDLEGSGRIRYTQFLAATIEAQGAISEERLAEAFDRLDSDDSGYISANNLADLLGKDFPRDEIDEIIRESNFSHSDQISYSEFLSLWEQKHEEEDCATAFDMFEDPPTSSSSMVSMGTSSSISNSTPLPTDSLNEIEAATERASFLKDKQYTSKHVGFGETIITIGQDI